MHQLFSSCCDWYAGEHFLYLFVISQNVALYCAYPVDLEKKQEGKNTLKLKNEANLQSVAIQNYSYHTITI